MLAPLEWFSARRAARAEAREDHETLQRILAGDDVDVFARGGGSGKEFLPFQAVYKRVLRDQVALVNMQTLSLATIRSAKMSATRGQMNLLGDVYSTVKTCDPVMKAARAQRLNGVARTFRDITPSGDTPAQSQSCDLVKAMFAKPRAASITAMARAITEVALEGGGFVETIWNDPKASIADGDKSRFPVKFMPVPMKRLRYGPDGGQRFAENSTDPVDKATPFENFKEGTFIPVIVDEEILDFGDRGSYRSLLSDSYARIKLFAAWLSALERYANPIPVGKGKLKSSRKLLSDAFENLGSSGAIVTDYDSDVQLVYSTVAQRGSGPYTEFLMKTDQRIFLALLGESQTGMIEPGAGSVASSMTHREVAQDVVEADWELISALASRWVFEPMVRMNLGDKMAVNTPGLTPNFEEVGDLLKLGQGVKAWTDLGFEDFTREWARKKLKVQQRKPKDTPLEAAKPEPPVIAAPPPPPAGAEPPVPAPADKQPANAVNSVVRGNFSRADIEALRRQLAEFADTIEAGALEAAMLAIEAGGFSTQAEADAILADVQKAEQRQQRAGLAVLALLLARLDVVLAGDSLVGIAVGVAALRADLVAAGALGSVGITSSAWREKQVVPYAVFDALAAAERSNAFSTAFNLEKDLLDQVAAAISRNALVGGDVRALVKPILDASPQRLALIYQMEMTRAANAGLYAVMFSPGQMQVLEGWQFYCREDACEICRPLGGMVFRKDDPNAWQFLPDLHFRCRCTVIGVALQADTVVSSASDITTRGNAGFDFDKLTPLRQIYGDSLGNAAAVEAA
jgi:hypothetical protein